MLARLPIRLRAVAALAVLAASTPANACPFPTPPVRDLSLDRFYVDEAGSETSAELLAQHRDATRPVRSYLDAVVSEADASLRRKTGSLGAYRARCALDLLEVWASGGGLLGTIEGKQSEAERRWSLAGLALAYLKVKPHASGPQRQTIEAWLVMLADRSLAAFDDPGVKRNNHWYWMGLGAGAVGLAAASDTHWQKARSVLADATRDIGPDGVLEAEMARGARALHYHVFALTPLTGLAALVRARGEDLKDGERAGLDRLAGLVAQGLDDPALFDARAGVVQERPAKPGAAWITLLRSIEPGALADFRHEMPSGTRWLGGNAALLMTALAAPGRSTP